MNQILSKLQKVLMITSLVFVVICLGVSVGAAIVLNDSSFYFYAAVFALATVWIGITIYNSYKKK